MHYLLILIFWVSLASLSADIDRSMLLMKQSMDFVDGHGEVHVDLFYTDKLSKITVVEKGLSLDVPSAHLVALKAGPRNLVGLSRRSGGLVLTVMYGDGPNEEGNWKLAKFSFKDGKYVMRTLVIPEVGTPNIEQRSEEGGACEAGW